MNCCALPCGRAGSASAPAATGGSAMTMRPLWRALAGLADATVALGYGAPGPGRAVFSVSAFMDVVRSEPEVAASSAD